MSMSIKDMYEEGSVGTITPAKYHSIISRGLDVLLIPKEQLVREGDIVEITNEILGSKWMIVSEDIEKADWNSLEQTWEEINE